MSEMKIVEMPIEDVSPKICMIMSQLYGITCRIKLYSKKYVVTEDGMIFTISKKFPEVVRKQKTRIKPNGYYRAFIHRRDEYVHRIVAKCFIPNPDGKKEINHKDGNKANNSVGNLEWSTRSENNRHAFQTGLRSYEELIKMAHMPKLAQRRFTNDDIKKMKLFLINKVGINQIARMFGVSHSEVQQIRDGKIYKEVQ